MRTERLVTIAKSSVLSLTQVALEQPESRKVQRYPGKRAERGPPTRVASARSVEPKPEPKAEGSESPSLDSLGAP